MAYAFIAATAKGSSNLTSVTTDAIDTTLAAFIVISAANDQSVASPTITDSKGNSWTALTASTTANTRNQLFYCISPIVGTGHTFTIASSTAPALAVAAFSVVTIPSPFDVQNGASTNGATTLATGSVTPSEDNELLIAGISNLYTGTPTIDLSFTATTSPFASGLAYGVGIAYLILPTAAAKNPTWTLGTSGGMAVRIAAFKSVTDFPFQARRPSLIQPILAM